MNQLPPSEPLDHCRECSSLPAETPSAIPIVPSVFRPLSGYARWLFFLFLLLMILYAADWYYSGEACLVLEALRDTSDSGLLSEYAARMDWLETRTAWIAAGTILVSIPVCIFFCLWGYRAAVNAVHAARQPVELKPGFFIGSFFIPLLNLWNPYMGMKRLYNISRGCETAGYRRFTWLVAFWWFGFLVFETAGTATFHLFRNADRAADTMDKSLENLDRFLSLCRNAYFCTMVSDALAIAAAVAAVFLVRRVTRAQTEMKERLF